MRVFIAALSLLALALCGCGPTHYWYGNQQALRASLASPLGGGVEERTFVDPSVKKRDFGKVYIAPPEVKLTRKEGLPADLAQKIASALSAGAAVAVNASERFGGIVSEEGAASEILSAEAQAHVAVSQTGQTVMADPVYGDSRSRIIVIYTLKDAKTGAVLVKSYGAESSYWEYTQRVTEDMARLAVNSGETLMYVLKEM